MARQIAITNPRIKDNRWLWEAYQGINNSRAYDDFVISDNYWLYLVILAGSTGGMNVMGAIDCSGNPNYPAATIGDVYRVSVAGRIGGGAGFPVSVGDVIICFTTSAAGTQAGVGANWNIKQVGLQRNFEVDFATGDLAQTTVQDWNGAIGRDISLSALRNITLTSANNIVLSAINTFTVSSDWFSVAGSTGKTSIGTIAATAFLNIDNAQATGSALLSVEFANGLGGCFLANRTNNTVENFGWIMYTGGANKWFIGMHQGNDNYFFAKTSSTGTQLITLSDTTSVVGIGTNLGIGTTSVGTNGSFCLILVNGVEPTADVANGIHMFSIDSADNTATLGFKMEQVVEAIGGSVADSKVKVKINGVWYWLLMDSV